MKKKKKPSGAAPQAGGFRFPASSAEWSRDLALGRRQALRDRQKQAALQERGAAFRRKLKSAPARRAPLTLRTRGYYRFSREYPANVDPAGFRENSVGKKTVRRRRRLTAIAAVLAFCCAFVVTKACLYASGTAPAETSAPTAGVTAPALRFTARRVAYAALRDRSGEALAEELRSQGADAAVLEMKDEAGYVMFESEAAAAADTARVIPELKDKLAAMKNSGVYLIAYFCCFADSAAPQAQPSNSVRVGGDDGEVWTDNAGGAWLNPFSADARAYLLTLLSDLASLGVDAVLLDGVCFSTDAGSGAAFYANESLYNGSRNQVLRDFLNDAVTAAAGVQVIALGNVGAFSADSRSDNMRYDGNLLNIPSLSLCLDARVSMQDKRVELDGRTFRDPASMADIFIMNASEYAVAAVRESDTQGNVIVCVDAPEDPAAAAHFAADAGADGLIFW